MKIEDEIKQAVQEPYQKAAVNLILLPIGWNPDSRISSNDLGSPIQVIFFGFPGIITAPQQDIPVL